MEGVWCSSGRSTLEDVWQFLGRERVVGIDLETQGLDPYTDKIITYQFGNRNVQYVLLDSVHPIEMFKDLLEDESKLFVGHNLKFDLRFTLHRGIVIKNVYDTYITEQILTNGLDFKYPKKSLDYVSKRHTGVFLDKSLRGLIHKGITDTVIKYAMDDVKYLIDIMNSQNTEAEKLDLVNAIKLNNAFVPVISYLEYCGFKLDSQKWMEKVAKDKEQLLNQEKLLNKYIIDNKIDKFIDKQLDLFSSELKTTINWNSPQQVISLFKTLNIPTSVVDPETGEKKDTVDSNHIKKYQHPLIDLYVKYKELQKRVSTYGENWLAYIHPITKRIHTKYQQWVTTGRMSSGGRDGDVQYPNAQNIPSDDETRSCIVPEDGYVFINADYDSQEVRVFTNFCVDETLVKMFKEGYDDMHSYTAWHIFPEIRDSIPVLNKETIKKVKDEFPKQRKISKLGNFAIQYGGTGYTIAENCNIPVEEGEKFYNQYFNTFTGVKEYFKWIYERSKIRGYIQYNNVTKEKYFIPPGIKDNKLKNYAYNYPVQGTSAAITKLAGVLYWKHLINDGLVFKVRIVIICHDEFLVEVPESIAEEEAQKLKQCMEEAGAYYCSVVPLTASPVITKFWKH